MMTNAIILRRRKLGRGSTNGIQQYSETGIKAVRNWMERDKPVVAPKYIFRWGCTSSYDFPCLDSKTVNTASSIHWCSDKRQGRLDMQAAGVPVPETWPSTAFRADFVQGLQSYANPDDSWVLRPAVHAQGRNLITGNAAMVSQYILNHSNYAGGYVSRFIDKEHEYRVFVCQNRVVWVAKKTPGNPEDVAWNVAAGGRFDNVRWGEWPLQVVRAALQAADVSGTDFCGVDVMVDHDGRPYVLEVNSAPSQTSPYRQQCVAKAFDYIVENGKEHFDDPENYSSWKNVIHPAVWSPEDD